MKNTKNGYAAELDYPNESAFYWGFEYLHLWKKEVNKINVGDRIKDLIDEEFEQGCDDFYYGGEPNEISREEVNESWRKEVEEQMEIDAANKRGLFQMDISRAPKQPLTWRQTMDLHNVINAPRPKAKEFTEMAIRAVYSENS